MQKLWRKNSLSVLCICLFLPFTHISQIPKYFLTLCIFFITYLLHEIDCSLLNLVQLYPDSERCRVGAEECRTTPRPRTLLYHQQTRDGTPDVTPTHVIFSFFYPSVWDCDTKLRFLPARESHGLPEQLVLEGSSGAHHAQSPGLDPHISCCFYATKWGGEGILGATDLFVTYYSWQKRRSTYSSLLCRVTLNCLCTVSSV